MNIKNMIILILLILLLLVLFMPAFRCGIISALTLPCDFLKLSLLKCC